jgi:hypothetical protein
MTTNKFSFINNPNIFIDNELLSTNMGQKLFCTFTLHSDLEQTLDKITDKYTILYDKIFVLESPQSDELMCTYNIDTNITKKEPIQHTILLHRKKESNTLYTINALNTLIKLLNSGILDSNFVINWGDYKNSMLLTNGPDIRKLETTIYKIINI